MASKKGQNDRQAQFQTETVQTDGTRRDNCAEPCASMAGGNEWIERWQTDISLTACRCREGMSELDQLGSYKVF